MSSPILSRFKFLALAASVGVLQACSTVPDPDPQGAEELAVTEAAASQAPAVDELPPDLAPAPPAAPKITMSEWSLLEMRYEEAKAISPQTAEVGPLFKVAAQSIEVLKTDKEGKPLKIKARGHVFLEMTLADRATALCEEAVVTAEEAVLKGKPMLMQASRIAKATSDSTSFRVTDHLKVSGEHELIRPEELMQAILAAADEHGNIDAGSKPKPVVASQSSEAAR